MLHSPRAAGVSSLAAAFLFVAAVLPDVAVQAQAPTRTYTKPVAELSEPYTSVRAVRELADGRLIVVDPRDKVVHLVDMKADRATLLGRQGSGPNEYQMPMSAFPLPGDSTMVADVLNSRFLMLGPGGALAGTWSPVADAPAEGGDRTVTRTVPARPGGGGGGGGGGATFMMAGPGGGMMSIMSTRATDARGNLYAEGSAVSMGPDGPMPADSIPLIRTARGSKASDTVTWLQRQKAQVSGGRGEMNVRIGGDPFPRQDGWSVLPDGRVVVVRATDYHVEVYPASGRGAAARGAPVRTPTIRVTEAEKQAWRDSRQSSGAIAIAVTATDGPGGASRSVAPANIRQQDPAEWPATLPAFQANQVYALPTGDVWVGRYRAASDKSPRYDVFDASGKQKGQVVFPPRTNIVGFGKGAVYTVRIDEDDLQYLQRYTLQ
jgi:hypothetical protein